jgi:hypothetical protein
MFQVSSSTVFEHFPTRVDNANRIRRWMEVEATPKNTDA